MLSCRYSAGFSCRSPDMAGQLNARKAVCFPGISTTGILLIERLRSGVIRSVYRPLEASAVAVGRCVSAISSPTRSHQVVTDSHSLFARLNPNHYGRRPLTSHAGWPRVRSSRRVQVQMHGPSAKDYRIFGGGHLPTSSVRTSR